MSEPADDGPQFELLRRCYARPTPAGAYYAVSTPPDLHDAACRLLYGLLCLPASPELRLPLLRQLVAPYPSMSVQDSAFSDHDVLAIVHDLQLAGFLEGLPSPDYAPEGALEDVLGDLLRPLSSNGRVLLVDGMGFPVAGHGFPPDAADALAAFSADLGMLHERHHQALRATTTLATGAWALVDGAGNSQVGFWPLHVGTERFVLIIAGLPRTNHPQLTALIWALCARYGQPGAGGESAGTGPLTTSGKLQPGGPFHA